MSQRLSLFNAGYHATTPAHYYSQLQLVDQLAPHAEGAVREHLDQLCTTLKQSETACLASLQMAGSTAIDLELQPGRLPNSADDYFRWLNEFVAQFEATYPMSKIDHYYFLFGRKLGEILSNLKLAGCCLELDARFEKALVLQNKSEKCIKDNEYILFKLIAPAALLSSEPRHNYFNVFYKKINAAYQPFRNLDLGTLGPDGMLALCAELDAFGKEVEKGYQECSTLLKELEV